MIEHSSATGRLALEQLKSAKTLVNSTIYPQSAHQGTGVQADGAMQGTSLRVGMIVA